ncbi:hypothetical protein M758_7G185400 [Ceratodon purpureus]|nr:hypothetical protein M758_7G185400 [Ceratodon purpureus]
MRQMLFLHQGCLGWHYLNQGSLRFIESACPPCNLETFELSNLENADPISFSFIFFWRCINRSLLRESLNYGHAQRCISSAWKSFVALRTTSKLSCLLNQGKRRRCIYLSLGCYLRLSLGWFSSYLV